MQLPRRVVEAVRSCRQAPPQRSVGSLSSDDTSNKRCGYELKQVRRCLLWFLEAGVLLLFFLGLAVLDPRPPECEVVSFDLDSILGVQFQLINTPIVVVRRLLTMESMKLVLPRDPFSCSQQSSLL